MTSIARGCTCLLLGHHGDDIGQPISTANGKIQCDHKCVMEQMCWIATGLITVMAWPWWGIWPTYLLQNNNPNLYYTLTSMMNCPQIVTRMYFYSQCQYGSVSVPVPALDQKSVPVQAWGPTYIHIVCQMAQPWLQMLTKVGQTNGFLPFKILWKGKL